MRYFSPQQRKDYRWDFTCQTSQGIYPLGYCAGYKPLKHEGVMATMFSKEQIDAENARIFPFRDKYHNDGHDSESGACNCYREFQLDQHLEFTLGEESDTQKKCQICGLWTIGQAMIRGEGFRYWHLCPDHQAREFVEKLWPAV